MTTFFRRGDGRDVIDSWSTRMASFRTADLLVVRRVDPAAPGLRAVAGWASAACVLARVTETSPSRPAVRGEVARALLRAAGPAGTRAGRSGRRGGRGRRAQDYEPKMNVTPNAVALKDD